MHGLQSVKAELTVMCSKHIHQQEGSIRVINMLIYNLSIQGTFEEQSSHLLKHIYLSLKQGPEYEG